jgi:hypothetical protein
MAAKTCQDRDVITRSPGRWVFILTFALSIAIRIGVAVAHPPADDGDQRLYRTLARGIASGAGYVNLRGASDTEVHPLLPFLVAGAMRLLPDERLAGMAVTMTIGALVCAVAAWIVGSSFGWTAGIATAIVLAFQPHHVLASARLEPDLLGALLGLALTAALVRERWVWAGVAVGLAYLNRPEAIFWIAGAAAFAWKRAGSWRALGGLALATVVLAGPFLVYLRGVEGRWTLTGKDGWVYLLGVHQYRSGGQPLDLARIPELRAEVGSPMHHAMTHPRELLLGYAYRSGILLWNIARQLAYGLLAPFLVAGWIVALQRARWAAWALAVPLVTLPVLPLGATFFRHSEVPAVVLLAFSGIGLGAGVERLRSTRG